jgi:hypothetical protein
MSFPGQELIEKLDELRTRLNRSGVERTAGLMRVVISNGGGDCSYYRKSLDIFLRKDYEDIHSLLEDIKKEMDNLGDEG